MKIGIGPAPLITARASLGTKRASCAPAPAAGTTRRWHRICPQSSRQFNPNAGTECKMAVIVPL